MQLLDHDGLTCLDHAVLDRPLHVSYDVTAPLDAYVWGTNSNFNLGLGNNTNRWHSSGNWFDCTDRQPSDCSRTSWRVSARTR